MSTIHSIFLHGWLGSPNDWLPLIEAFPLTKKINMALPGHFETPALTENNWFSPMIEIINNQAKQTKSKKISLIAYSLGGRIALSFAEKYPEKIEKLFLISTHPGIENVRLRAQHLNQEHILASTLNSKPFSQFLNEWYSQDLFYPLSDALKNDIIQKRLKNNPPYLNAALKGFSHQFYHPKYQCLSQLLSKTIYIAGEKDKKYASFAKQIHALGIKTYVIPKAGHALLETHTKPLLSIIKHHLKHD